jgi:hypothetical protein
MPKKAAGLTAAKVRTAQPGRYGDGAGLYLLVRPAEAKYWIFRYTRAGKMREMGLGPAAGPAAVSLKDAREKARELHYAARNGLDPLDERDTKEAKRKADEALAAAKAMTFDACAAAYITAHQAGWRNAKHASQWPNTLRDYVSPVFDALPVDAVDTGLVMKALEPIWTLRPETASRVRGRIESVLAWATVRGYRTGANPAQWRNHLDHLLPARSKVRKVEHHSALSYHDVPAFMARLRERPDISSAALQFLILTAARSGEVLGARWSEFDIGRKSGRFPPTA